MCTCHVTVMYADIIYTSQGMAFLYIYIYICMYSTHVHMSCDCYVCSLYILLKGWLSYIYIYIYICIYVCIVHMCTCHVIVMYVDIIHTSQGMAFYV